MDRATEEIIKRCQLFAEVDPRRCQKLAEISRVHQYAKQQMVFHQGQECPGVFIVDTGMVRVFKTAPSGKEHVLHMVAPGQTFAEVAAIGNFACPAHAEAVEPTRCVLIPVQSFREQMVSDHQLCLEMMTGMSFWVRRLISLMEDLVLRDALGRTARFLLESEVDPDGMVRLPSLKRHVASHLNLTSETLSRTLSRLIEAGLLVEHDKNRVQLRNLLQLRAVSEGKYPEI
jgi:CRP/FNR family transcriptional regulator, dissimilatory nitrate respiration regulator